MSSQSGGYDREMPLDEARRRMGWWAAAAQGLLVTATVAAVGRTAGLDVLSASLFSTAAGVAGVSAVALLSWAENRWAAKREDRRY